MSPRERRFEQGLLVSLHTEREHVHGAPPEGRAYEIRRRTDYEVSAGLPGTEGPAPPAAEPSRGTRRSETATGAGAGGHPCDGGCGRRSERPAEVRAGTAGLRGPRRRAVRAPVRRRRRAPVRRRRRAPVRRETAGAGPRRRAPVRPRPRAPDRGAARPSDQSRGHRTSHRPACPTKSRGHRTEAPDTPPTEARAPDREDGHPSDRGRGHRATAPGSRFRGRGPRRRDVVRGRLRRQPSGAGGQPPQPARGGARGLHLVQSAFYRVADQFHTAVELELAEGVLDVVLDRAVRDDQALRDLLVAEALGDQAQDLGLALGEVRPSAGRGWGRAPRPAGGTRRGPGRQLPGVNTGSPPPCAAPRPAVPGCSRTLSRYPVAPT